LGDSKSIVSTKWPTILLSSINALDNPSKVWEENIPRGWAVGGRTVALAKAAIDADIASHTVNADVERNVFLVNLGANDVAYIPTKSQWKSDYQYIIDAIVAKWANAEIFIAKAWRRNYAANCDSLASWVDELIAENPTTCFSGHDERTWLEGGDDGATMTTDGIHYTSTGSAECARQWKTILGY
jgi:hypothetical protein